MARKAEIKSYTMLIRMVGALLVCLTVTSCEGRSSSCQELSYNVIGSDFVASLSPSEFPTAERDRKLAAIGSCLRDNPVEPMLTSDDEIIIDKTYASGGSQYFRVSYPAFTDIDLLVEFRGSEIVALYAIRGTYIPS